MSILQGLRCGQVTKTTLGHIRELADTQHRTSTGLSITIDRLEAEIDILKVIQEVWMRAEFDTAHLVEETDTDNQEEDNTTDNQEGDNA